MTTSHLVSGVLGALLAAALLAAPQPGQAAVQTTGCAGGSFGDSCGLDELVGGGSITVGGYTFSNFALTLNAGRLATAGAIRVDAIDGAGGSGFALIDTGPTLRASSGDLTSNNIGFNITSVAGSMLISGITLVMSVGDINGSEAYAFADFFDPGFTTLLGNATAYCDGPPCSNSSLSTAAAFASGQGAMSVVAGLDIAAGPAGLAQVNGISLVLTPVPEPASWSLLGVGLGALLWRRRRRRHYDESGLGGGCVDQFVR